MLMQLDHAAAWSSEVLKARAAQPFSARHEGTIRQSILALRLQQNRSSLPKEGRIAVVAMLVLAFACTVGAGLRGQLFVPMAVVGSMAALLVAIEWFSRLPIPHETLVITSEWTTFHDHRGRSVRWPTYWTRVVVENPTWCDLRVYLIHRQQRLEIGRCIDIGERTDAARIVELALQEGR